MVTGIPFYEECGRGLGEREVIAVSGVYEEKIQAFIFGERELRSRIGKRKLD